MEIFCENCGTKINPILNFCFFCGTGVPRLTIPTDLEPDKFEDRIYCPKCKYECPEDAFYCGSCGEYIYEKNAKISFCPFCSTKISSEAKICSKCGLSLEDFFSLKGKVAKKNKVFSNFVLKEKMTGKSFHFFLRDEIKIGRHPSNDIVIPCHWVSSFHLILDFKNMVLKDQNSTNGSFVNMSDKRINKSPLSLISEFNIAGTFTFKVVQKAGVFSFFLRTILNRKEVVTVGNETYYDTIQKNSYIKFFGNDDIKIRHYDGFMFNENVIKKEYYKIFFEDGFLYYSDPERNIKKILIMQENNFLPKNWEINIV